jgi:N-methylhydantoinase A
VHEVNVPLRGSADRAIDDAFLARAREDFEGLYRQRYGEGSTSAGAVAELVTFRVRGEGRVDKPEQHAWPDDPTPLEQALVEERTVFLPYEDRAEAIPGLDFNKLGVGSTIDGPALIWSPITTVVLGSKQRATIDPFLNIVIETGRS